MPLAALAEVVAALADGKPHVPFRNDPLTQLPGETGTGLEAWRT